MPKRSYIYLRDTMHCKFYGGVNTYFRHPWKEPTTRSLTAVLNYSTCVINMLPGRIEGWRYILFNALHLQEYVPPLHCGCFSFATTAFADVHKQIYRHTLQLALCCGGGHGIMYGCSGECRGYKSYVYSPMPENHCLVSCKINVASHSLHVWQSVGLGWYFWQLHKSRVKCTNFWSQIQMLF